MVSTFQALGVFLLALLPGAAYTFAYERQAGSFTITASDRIIRLLAASALFQAVFAGPGYLAYKSLIESGHLREGQVSAWLVEFFAILYVAVPLIVGSVIGRGQTRPGRAWAWTRWFAVAAPEPTAWDHVWRHASDAIVRVKLKSGVWTAGAWGRVGARRPYASGYPEPADLYLPVVYLVDKSTGEFGRDSAGNLVPLSGSRGILLRWEEIEFIEILGA